MYWIYEQLTGKFYLQGRDDICFVGYSGKKGKARNNPDYEHVPFEGPIPYGKYQIGSSFDHEKLGPVVMSLRPIGHDCYGRDNFAIHGDNMQNDASRGCIVLNRDARKKVAESSIDELYVILGGLDKRKKIQRIIESAVDEIMKLRD